MILWTWGTIFACQIRLRQLSDRRRGARQPLPGAGSPTRATSGSSFLALVLIGLTISGWPASPDFLHKTSFLVVVFGIPLLASRWPSAGAWSARGSCANTGGRLESVWTLDGPRYGSDVTPDALDRDKQDDTRPPADASPRAPSDTTGGRSPDELVDRDGRAGRVRPRCWRALAGCGGRAEPNADPSLVPGASSGGRLTIGIPVDEPGIGMKDGDTYTGFDVETATYVAAALGVPAANITWVEAEGDDRQQLLQSGGADLIVSTFSITDERKQVVDFAGPYFDAYAGPPRPAQRGGHHRPGHPRGRTLCTVVGHDLGRQRAHRYKDRIRWSRSRATPSAWRPSRERRRRGDHRRRDPRGLRRGAAVQGKLRVSARASRPSATASGSRRATPSGSRR